MVGPVGVGHVRPGVTGIMLSDPGGRTQRYPAIVAHAPSSIARTCCAASGGSAR